MNWFSLISGNGKKSASQARRHTRRRKHGLRVETLEKRNLLAVDFLDITSVESSADMDAGVPGEVSVLGGSAVAVMFNYSTASNRETLAKLDIDTGSGSVTSRFVSIPSGADQTATLTVDLPEDVQPGTYTAKVQLKNGNGRNSTVNERAEDAINVMSESVVEEPYSVIAPDMTFTGEPYDDATVLDEEGVEVETGVTLTYYDAADTELLTPLASSPTEEGDYLVVATVQGEEGTEPFFSEPVEFSILPVDVTAPPVELDVDIQTSGAINLMRSGVIPFEVTLADLGQIPEGQSLQDLFGTEPITATLQVNGTDYEVELTGEVVDDSLEFGLRMDGELRAALIEYLNENDLDDVRSLSDLFTLSGASSDGAYTFTSTVQTRLFQPRGRQR